MMKQKIKNGVEKSKKWVSKHGTELAVLGYGLTWFGYGCFVTCVVHKGNELRISNGIGRLHEDGFLTTTMHGENGLLVKVDDLNDWIKEVDKYYNLKG